MEKKIYKTVESTLKNAEIQYSIEDDNIFTFGVVGEHAKFNIRVICEEEMEVLISVVTCSICIPKNKIDKMCRWVIDKNYQLALGGFKIDTSDGELSFRVTCPLDNGAVNEDVVAVAFSCAMSVFDNNYDKIMKAIYFDESNEDGLAKMAEETIRRELVSAHNKRIPC